MSNTNTAEIIAFDDAALETWHKRIAASVGKEVADILARAKECYEFRQACDRTSGGSVYSAKMLEWFAIPHPESAYWARVGAAHGKLVTHVLQLAPSMRVMYLLCDVPDEIIAQKVTPKTTAREAAALAKEHAVRYRANWRHLLINKLGVRGIVGSGSATRMKARLEKEFGPLPAHFTSEAQAEAFLADYVRVIGLKPPQVDQAERRAAKARQRLAEKDQKKVDVAIAAERSRLEAEFNDKVEQRVKTKLAAREAWFDEQEALVKEKEAQLDAARASIITYMTELEYKLVLNCLHPDRVPAAQQDKYSKAFAIFKRLEPYTNLNIPLKVLRERGWAK